MKSCLRPSGSIRSEAFVADVEIGQFRHRLELQSVTETITTLGGVPESWETYATVYGAVAAISGNERFATGMLGGTVVYRILIRYRDDVKIKDRIVWNGRTFDIAAILDVSGERRWLRIEATEAVE